MHLLMLCAQLLLTDHTFGSRLSSCRWLKKEKAVSCRTHQVHVMKVQEGKRMSSHMLAKLEEDQGRRPTMSCNGFRHKLHLLLLIMPVMSATALKLKPNPHTTWIGILLSSLANEAARLKEG